MRFVSELITCFEFLFFFFFSSRRRHTRSLCDWSSDVCSSDLNTWSVREAWTLAARGESLHRDQPPPSSFRLSLPRWGTAARRETTAPRAASSCPPRRATGRRHARRWRGVGVLRGCGAPTHWCFSPP